MVLSQESNQVILSFDYENHFHVYQKIILQDPLYLHTSLSPRLGGRLYLAWAVWAVKLMFELLV